MTTELFHVFTGPLDAAGIRYMVTGSVASTLYGEPRLTHDIDLIVELARAQVPALLSAFNPAAFYVPPEETLIEEALRPTRGHFNILHHASGFKADIYLAGRDGLRRWGLGLRRKVPLGDGHLWVAPPEYVILRKLEYFREGGSEKHLRDIRAMLAALGPALDVGEIERRAADAGLGPLWERVQRPG